MNTREQGDIGEYSAIEWFGRRGHQVFLPVGHSPDVDLVVHYDGRLQGVQVKTATYERRGRYEVLIATRGGNQSWSGVAKLFSASRCDLLFIHVADGRRWLIPSCEVGGTSALQIGGPKYARYEIDPGPPLRVTRAA